MALHILAHHGEGPASGPWRAAPALKLRATADHPPRCVEMAGASFQKFQAEIAACLDTAADAEREGVLRDFEARR